MKTAIQAQPLTKRDSKNNRLYKRRKRVEAAIREALGRDLVSLVNEAEISDRKNLRYMPSECLLHLIRDALRRGKEDVLNALVPLLFARCEMLLRGHQLHTFEDLQEEVRGKFAELLAENWADAEANDLDFYEVRFNKAFAAFRIDIIRAHQRQKTTEPLIEEKRKDEDGNPVRGDADTIKAILKVCLAQRDPVLQDELRNAVAALPEDERIAIILCYFYGYPEESEDPSQVTAATLCKVTGRTIRNRLAKAFSKLKSIYNETDQ